MKPTYLATCEKLLSKNKAEQWDWFDESDQDLKKVNKRKKDAYNRHLAQPTERKKEEFQEVKKQCQQEIRKIKDEWWQMKMAALQEFSKFNDTHNLYQGINRIVGPIRKPLNIIKDKRGNVVKAKTDQLNRWTEHFNEILNQDNPIKLNSLDSIGIHENLISDSPQTLDEVFDAMQDLKNNKRSGEDQLTAEMIKAGENISVSMLHNLLKEIWKSKQVPQDWKNSVVIPIFKKRDKTECTNYRGISLLSVPGKILSRILYNRMAVLGDIFLRDGQCGFQKKRSTIDMIFAARQLVEKAIEQKPALA